MTVPAPRVYIIDDDEGIREALRFLLEESDYELEEATDGQEALALMRRDPRPRVALLDRMMARMDGVETLRHLLSEPEVARHVAVVFMTARGDPPDPETARLLEQGAFATVSKPFDLDALLATIDAASRSLTTPRHAAGERDLSGPAQV